MNNTIGIDGLESSLQEFLDEFGRDCTEAMAKVVKQTSSDLAKDLKSSSPVRTGKYASSWKSKKTGENLGNVEYTVYSTKPGLPHLLEFGHRKVSRSGRVLGTTPAKPHIASAAERAEENFEKHLREAIEK